MAARIQRRVNSRLPGTIDSDGKRDDLVYRSGDHFTILFTLTLTLSPPGRGDQAGLPLVREGGVRRGCHYSRADTGVRPYGRPDTRSAPLSASSSINTQGMLKSPTRGERSPASPHDIRPVPYSAQVYNSLLILTG